MVEDREPQEQPCKRCRPFSQAVGLTGQMAPSKLLKKTNNNLKLQVESSKNNSISTNQPQKISRQFLTTCENQIKTDMIATIYNSSPVYLISKEKVGLDGIDRKIEKLKTEFAA